MRDSATGLAKVIRSPKPAIRRSVSPGHDPKGPHPKEPLLRKDASPQSLQLTYCHGHPPNASTLELRAYACLTSPSRRKPSPTPTHGFETCSRRGLRWLAASGIPSLEQRRNESCAAGCDHRHLPREGSSAFPNGTTAGFFGPTAAETTRPLTPPVAPPLAPGTAPGLFEGARTLPSPATFTADGFQIRGTVHRQIPLDFPRRLRAGFDLAGRHWYLARLRSAQLPMCVHVRLSHARPAPDRLLTDACEPHTVHRFLQLKRPRARPGAFQTSPLWSTTASRRTR